MNDDEWRAGWPDHAATRVKAGREAADGLLLANAGNATPYLIEPDSGYGAFWATSRAAPKSRMQQRPDHGVSADARVWLLRKRRDRQPCVRSGILRIGTAQAACESRAVVAAHADTTAETVPRRIRRPLIAAVNRHRSATDP